LLLSAKHLFVAAMVVAIAPYLGRSQFRPVVDFGNPQGAPRRPSEQRDVPLHDLRESRQNGSPS
jgi:hypothetical protein